MDFPATIHPSQPITARIIASRRIEARISPSQPVEARISPSTPIETVITPAQPINVSFRGSGPRGLQGLPGEQSTIINFAWGDATPAILAEAAAGATVYSISLVMLEPFDGAGAALSIGVTGAPEFFMAENGCDPTVAGVYSVNPGYRFPAPAILRLFITPGAGASKGNGAVVMTIRA